MLTRLYINSNTKFRNLRMTRWLYEEEAAMNSGILDVALPLRSKLLSQVRRVLILDVFDNWIPATSYQSLLLQGGSKATYHLSLLTRSPYPGVSTILSRRRTPFSSMTEHVTQQSSIDLKEHLHLLWDTA